MVRDRENRLETHSPCPYGRLARVEESLKQGYLSHSVGLWEWVALSLLARKSQQQAYFSGCPPSLWFWSDSRLPVSQICGTPNDFPLMPFSTGREVLFCFILKVGKRQFQMWQITWHTSYVDLPFVRKLCKHLIQSIQNSGTLRFFYMYCKFLRFSLSDVNELWVAMNKVKEQWRFKCIRNHSSLLV